MDENLPQYVQRHALVIIMILGHLLPAKRSYLYTRRVDRCRLLFSSKNSNLIEENLQPSASSSSILGYFCIAMDTQWWEEVRSFGAHIMV